MDDTDNEIADDVYSLEDGTPGCSAEHVRKSSIDSEDALEEALAIAAGVNSFAQLAKTLIARP